MKLKLNPRTLRLISHIESSSLWSCAMLNYDQVEICNIILYCRYVSVYTFRVCQFVCSCVSASYCLSTRYYLQFNLVVHQLITSSRQYYSTFPLITGKAVWVFFCPSCRPCSEIILMSRLSSASLLVPSTLRTFGR